MTVGGTVGETFTHVLAQNLPFLLGQRSDHHLVHGRLTKDPTIEWEIEVFRFESNCGRAELSARWGGHR